MVLVMFIAARSAGTLLLSLSVRFAAKTLLASTLDNIFAAMIAALSITGGGRLKKTKQRFMP
jgi:hypothetical protein